MAFNPLAYVMDFGAPKIISGKAREVISGGQFVYTSGANNVVGSTVDSYAIGDIQFCAKPAARSETFCGVALATVASGATVPVAIEGVFIVNVAGSVFASECLMNAGDDSVDNIGSFVVPANAEDSAAAGKKIGRALTAAASGNYCLAYLSI